MSKLQFTKQLRKNQTEAESRLWYYLRKKQLNGIKFRRQHQIGSFIVDFLSIKHKLVIELDGGQHNDFDVQKYDSERTKYLKKSGFKVIRFWNNDVISNTDEVINQIAECLSTAP